MIALLFTVIPLGIGAAFTPSLFALQLLIVGGDPWRTKALAAFLGSAVAFGIALSLLLLGFTQLPKPPAGGDPLGASIKIGAAVVLVAMAVYFAIPHPQMQQRVERDIEHRVATATPIEFFGVTFLLSIKDVSSFVLLIPAIHEIGVADIDWPFKVAITLLVLALALSGLIIPPVLRVVLGHRHSDVLQRIYAFTMRNQFRIMAVVFAVLALFLLMSGLREW